LGKACAVTLPPAIDAVVPANDEAHTGTHAGRGSGLHVAAERRPAPRVARATVHRA